MAEHTPTEANTWEGGAGLVLPDEAGLAAAFARGICATPADKDAYSKSLDIARRGIEEIKAEVRADERAKRPDRAALERIAAECGADIPYDDGNETAKLIGKRIREALALEPEVSEEAGPALRIDDDGAHIYWADPVEGCWVAFKRVDCVGEEELPERRLPAPEAREEAELFHDQDGDLWKFTDKGEWFHEDEPGEFRQVLSIDAEDQTLTPVGHAELAHAPEAREVTDADSKSRKVLDDLREWIEENRPINGGMFNDGSDDDATALLKIIRRADA